MRRGTNASGPILALEAVAKSFGGLRAVDGASFAVAAGSITALIGPNGAGKTTVFDLISGYERPNSRRRALRRATHRRSCDPPHRQARARADFQLTRTFAAMSVRDNMLIGAQRQAGESTACSCSTRGRQTRRGGRGGRAPSALMRAFALDRKADDYAGSLSGGQRKLLEFARALMAEPKLVLLDEPMAGVNRALGAKPARRGRAAQARRGHDVPLHRARHRHRHAAR